MWGHGGDGGATAVVVRCHGGHGGAVATPVRIGPTRCCGGQLRNHCGTTAIMAVLLRFMPYKHRSGTGPPV